MSKTVSLVNGRNRVDVSAVLDNSSPDTAADARVSVEVHSNGFSGRCEAFVTRDSLRRFCTDLRALNVSLAGEAVLESISPDKLVIRIGAVTGRGHLAVSGQIGCHIVDENSRQWHAVHFGFEFEQPQLAEAVRTDWVQQNAE